MLVSNPPPDVYHVPVFVDMHKVETIIFDIMYSVPLGAVEMNYPLPQARHSSVWLQTDWCRLG